MLLRWIQKAGHYLGLAVAVVGFAAIAAVVLFAFQGIQFVTILTPSMTASGMPAGTAFLSKPIAGSDIASGDFILATSPYGDSVMHSAVGVPVANEDGRLILTMKGSSNDAVDAYAYDVTEGASEVFWSMPGLGTWIGSLWNPIPGTEFLAIPLPNGSTHSGLPFIVVVIFALVLIAAWPTGKQEKAAPAESLSSEAQKLHGPRKTPSQLASNEEREAS